MHPDVSEIWNWLEQVPDPEIPVISVVDLGIVRNMTWKGQTLEVALTPTYSGCPATSVIAMDVETALRDRGIDRICIRSKLSPPWTTDWISEKGRKRLEEYGIAPPRQSGGPEKCPLCGSKAVERVSQFGSTPCKAQWRCKSCLEPFDYFKCL
ncbi:MAG: phenylacetate-CoA oxygenase subunit PaaJ [Roseovarius sp.]|nr:phenylacetate-CoA oxygenase subunit PaaJ [Roseovarius sp.]MCY4208728.1 phenylacetate-CoA oxygenase subunit PaaJ [Roseovarius sp.]MCY4293083.1 phenylacetate-CoA oxygenase subunit PaaJ [Roseovarius sp.]